jgi:diacylglycerol kinase (ATP)
MSPVLIFANPIAGAGRAKSTAESLSTRLRNQGYQTQLVYDRIDAVDLSRLPQNAHAAVVIGGDGTLRAVATKLTEAPGLRVPPLLVVPMGTANLMGQYLGINKHDDNLVDRLVAAIQRRQITELDAARANGVPFLLVAGAGIDGAIIHELDKRRHGPIDLLDYALPTALTLLHYAYPPVTLTVDGRTVMDDEPGMVMVGNIPQYGTGFPMLPLARPDDGLLDILAIRVKDQIQALHVLLHAVAGEHLDVENTTYLRGKHISVTSPTPIAVQADGEAAGFTPLMVDLLPVRVPFIVP